MPGIRLDGYASRGGGGGEEETVDLCPCVPGAGEGGGTESRQ